MELPSAARRVLVVDDNADILVIASMSLRLAGFEVATAPSAAAARDWLERHGLPHLAVVDIMMPEVDGITLCREILAYCDLPVIMMTAVEDPNTVVATLKEIAEDYVVKPFDPMVLAARVERVIRRFDYAVDLARFTRIDDRLGIDFVGKRIEVEGRSVGLTPSEAKIFHILLGRSGRPVTTEYLLGRLWPAGETFEDALRVHVHRLRKKIEPDPLAPRYLVTERGLGYRLAVGGASAS